MPFECYWGEYNDYLQKCVCSVGYTGDHCETQDINNPAGDSSILEILIQSEHSRRVVGILSQMSLRLTKKRMS